MDSIDLPRCAFDRLRDNYLATTRGRVEENDAFRGSFILNLGMGYLCLQLFAVSASDVTNSLLIDACYSVVYIPYMHI